MSDVSDKLERLQRLDADLSAQIRALEAQTAPQHPTRKALLEDPHLIAQAVARFLFWRRYLATRRPSSDATLLRVWRQLVGRFIWRAARLAATQARSLPVREGRTPPVWAWTTLRAQRAVGAGGDDTTGNPDNPDDTLTDDAADWWAEYGDPAAAAELGADGLGLEHLDADTLATYVNGNGLPEGSLGAWADFAGVAGAVVDLKRLARLVTPADRVAAAQALSFADVLTLARQSGLSDMQLAQMVDASWNGQAALFAQDQTLGTWGAAPTEGGIGGVFDLHDSPMLTYLRDQAGYRITQITESQRTLMTNTLWLGLGGDTRFAPRSVDAAARLLTQMWDAANQNPLQMSRARAYMIAATETARAESFGSMVAMYRLGVLATTWVVTTGACLRCLGNGEAGPVPLYQSYPSGVQAPPAHPLCRCSLSPALDDSVNPAQWQSRDPAPLLAALTAGLSADSPNLLTWPESAFDAAFFDAVDLSDAPDIAEALDAGGGLPDVALMQTAPARGAVRRRGGRQRPAHSGPYAWLVQDGGDLLSAMHAAHISGPRLGRLGMALAGAAELSAARWLEVARMDVPLTPEGFERFSEALREERLASDARLRRRIQAADDAYALDQRRRFDAVVAAWRREKDEKDEKDEKERRERPPRPQGEHQHG